MNEAADYLVVFGRFYPEYDIAVSLLWAFIILSGTGNWVVMWCILKTKSLRNPFNMVVLALAFANGVTTTVVGPMELIRTLMAYNQVSTHWCNARVLLKTFCFSVSIMIIFTVGAMRLTAGLRKTPRKLTFKTTGPIIGVIYGLAIVTAPVFLDKTSATYRNCMGNVHVDLLKIILQNEGLMSTESMHASTKIQAHNDSQSVTYNDGIWLASTKATTEITSTTYGFSNMTFPYNETVMVDKSPVNSWLYYLAITLALFIGTVICYIGLLIVLKRRKNAMKSMVLGNSKDILTVHVAAYVTCTSFISFLVPYFPGLTRLHPQTTAANLHYVSIFHCLSSLDGALTPIIYYFSNPIYRNALIKSLPDWMRRCFCNSTQIASQPSAQHPFPPVSDPVQLAVVPSVLVPRVP